MGPSAGDARGSRLSFDDVAEAYDRGRPSYPAALVAKVLDWGGVERPRVLDVGAGTGKATVLFAPRCSDVVALEPSQAMAGIATRNRARWPHVSVIESTLEDWPERPYRFDLVISAQAWHWVDPKVGYSKARQLLRPTGALALFWNRPVWDGHPAVKDLLDAYRRFAPDHATTCYWSPGFTGPAPEPYEDGLAETFGSLNRITLPWTQRYSAADYVDLVLSLPELEGLVPSQRVGLLDTIRRIFEAAGGEVQLAYEAILYVDRLLA